MRHRVYGKKLNRSRNERAGLFKSLVQSLLSHGTIITSEAKASAIKGLVDKIINLAKNKNTRVLLQTYLINKDLQERLVNEIIPKLEDRTSGYTSQVRMGIQQGDRTIMVKMSIIGNEDLKPIEKKTTTKKLEESKKVEEVKKTAPKKEIQKKVITQKSKVKNKK